MCLSIKVGLYGVWWCGVYVREHRGGVIYNFLNVKKLPKGNSYEKEPSKFTSNGV